jgi:lysophospholipase L1-like esterase
MTPALRAVLFGRRALQPAPFIASVAFIGDSRVYDGETYWKGASYSDAKGIPLAPGFVTGQSVTTNTTGSLEYRAADAHWRWTVLGDSAGPWTAMFAGWNDLESGTAGGTLRIGLKAVSALPVSDQTVTITISGSLAYAYKAIGFAQRVMHSMYWLNESPKFCGLGGNTTADVVEQLPWIATQATGSGYDVIQLSTNDISGATALATVTANLRTIFDTRLALGRKLVIVGEPARWGTAINTPMTAGQQTLFDGINSFMASYAAATGSIFVDMYALTYDSGASDRRPVAGVLRDAVHYSTVGAGIAARAIAAAISARTGKGTQRYENSAGNLLSIGYMAGTTGTKGDGCSGTVPTGWAVVRSLGSELTAVFSRETRADGVNGTWMVVNIAATTGLQNVQIASAALTLASLGLAVGDTIYIEAEIDATAVSGGLIECDTRLTFTGASATLRPQMDGSATVVAQTADHTVRRSPNMVIPAGTTTVTFAFNATTLDATTATLKIGSVAIVKVA